MLEVSLVPHPDFPPRAVEAVTVSADIRRGATTLTYRVRGEAPRMLPHVTPARADNLWKHTCFELFVKPADGAGYFEFNFSPSTQWAAYRFDGYRTGMADQPLSGAAIEVLEDGVRVELDLGGLPAGDWQVAITAVIEEMDGTKSFWSAAHPAGNPDFHDGACFVVQVPAPSGA